MKKILIITILASVCASVLGGATLVHASIANWQKGVAINPLWNGEFASTSFQQSLTNLTTTHANYVTLVIPLYQSNLYSEDIQAGGNTPTDSALISGITYAHSIGLKVMLKPHLDSYTGDWRANINPSDRTTWFNNYGNMLAHYAQIAQQYGVEDLCIGTELIDMTDPSINSSNTQNWDNLIAKIRGIYSGRLTYSANWGPSGWTDEKNHIQFWNELDYIGISAYFNLYGDNSVQNLENQWNNYNMSDIQPLSQRWGKSVVFTEIGYRSVTGAHTQPWDYNLSGPADQVEQANDYQALFDYWSNYSFIQGVDLWDWSSNPNAGGSGDTGYTPQNKQAQGTMTTWFAGSGNPGSGSAKFTASASISPGQSSVNQPTTITTTVNDQGTAQNNVLIDVEVYNSSGQKIFQQFYGGQNFTQGQSQTYQASWSPKIAGNYTIKIGAFSSDWTQNYLWVNNAATVNVSGGYSSGPQTIDVWWPTNGVTVSGLQPFKAMLTNLNVSQYNMYWQVDGGNLVFMNTNNTNYPHKEALVDLSGWTWKGNGPYIVNFVAKDLNGNILYQQAISIYISH